MMNITINKEKNGIEVRFDAKPESNILSVLKENGFRWSPKQKIWYAKHTEERMNALQCINGCDKNKTDKVNTNIKEYTLWDMTRTENIENHFEKEHLYDTKQIAAIIRKHLRERFKMCKWSVTSDINSINLKLMVSPWAKDSEEVKAIVHYAYVFAESYNYDNSDSMTDYFDVNFYGVYESNIVDYDYEQREATVAEYNIGKKFEEDKYEYDQEKDFIECKEYHLRKIQMDAERDAAKERNAVIEKEEQEILAELESSVIIRDVDYFVLNAETTQESKVNTIEGYYNDYNGEIEVKIRKSNCRIAKEVYMNQKCYNFFKRHLLDDYTFLRGMGGTETNDYRVRDFSDYSRLDESQRKTIEWYANECVAIFCDGNLKLIINPEGHSYARYVFFFKDDSKIVDQYYTKNSIECDPKIREEHEKNKKLAEELEDVSTNIIADHNLYDTWKEDANYLEYMKEYIYVTRFPLSVAVIREIEYPELKSAMYKLLDYTNRIQEHFKRSGLKEGQRITIFEIGDLGGMCTGHAVFKSFQCGKYAQYDDAVKLVIRPERKRQDYYEWIHGNIIIVDGYVDYPQELFWEISIDEHSITRKSKYHMHDKEMYYVLLDYLNEHKIDIIVNTCKPR